jgi:hypothetical protein
VTGARRAIEHPLFLDFSGYPVPPLKFVLQSEYTPAGIVERPSPGVTASHSPWYSELGLKLTGADETAVVYLLPMGGERGFLAACLDQTFEPFFQVMSGADYGDGVTHLVAQHWPDVHAMLLDSNRAAPEGRVLCKVITPGVTQWAVADPVLDSQLNDITSEHLTDLVGTAVRTTVRALDPIQLPGLIRVLGGPDRTSRRLKAFSSLLGAGADLGGTFQGGIQADELLELGKHALQAVSSMRQLRD